MTASLFILALVHQVAAQAVAYGKPSQKSRTEHFLTCRQGSVEGRDIQDQPFALLVMSVPSQAQLTLNAIPLLYCQEINHRGVREQFFK